MKLNLLLLLLLILKLSFAQDDEFEEAHEHFEGDDQGFDEQQQEQQQQEQKPKGKMAPDSQRIVLEAVSAECYDPVYAVINGEAEQKDLNEECNKELVSAFQKTPIGALQQRELYASQLAALLRVSPSCRKQIELASKPPSEEGSAEEVQQPSESCIESFQKQMKDMQQWITATTVSRMSKDCSSQIQSGNLGEECEAEFVSVKPGVLETLENQNQQKLKEPVKEEKPKTNSTEKAKKPKPAKKEKPFIDPSFLFFVLWTLIIGGALVFVCLQFYKTPEKYVVAKKQVVEEPKEEISRKQKKEAIKQAKREKNAKFAHF